MYTCITVGCFFNYIWFNDCILGKSGRTVNPTVAKVDPILYYSVYVCESINCERRKNLQFTINRYSQF